MKSKVLLLFILIIAIFLRFYQLGINPPFLNPDEAAWGYNAYAIGIDGKDEFGKFLPHDYLESFGDFKPPVYAYLTILPVKVFGLTPLATRFPSAFLGVLTVLITYFLVKRLFPSSKYKEWYGLASALVLALSPWHIMLSRAAFEANVGTFFLVTGIWLFLAGIQEKKWLLIPAAVTFVTCIYTFNSVRTFAPIIVLVLSICFIKRLWQRKTQAIIAAIVGILLILPTLTFLLSPQAKLRFQEVNIFSDITVLQHANQEVQNDNNSKVSKVLHHRVLVYGVDFLKHYLDNLNPVFLFISGDGNPEFSTQDVGQMYLWDLPFFILGILLLFKKREDNWWVIPVWLLLGIIPAGTAVQTPHALRTETTLPTFQILVAIGVVNAYLFVAEKIKRPLLFKGIIAGGALLLVLNIFYFQHGYYTYYPYKYSGVWEYGYKDTTAYVNQVQNQYKTIVVSTASGRPYIYYLFFLHISPDYFRKTAVVNRDNFGFVDIPSFGKFIFTHNPPSVQTTGLTLYLDHPENVPAKAHILKKFYYLNGEESWEAYTL